MTAVQQMRKATRVITRDPIKQRNVRVG
jgi:hypothetical protein